MSVIISFFMINVHKKWQPEMLSARTFQAACELKNGLIGQKIICQNSVDLPIGFTPTEMVAVENTN